jgi:SpoVK/Ycf46/Vps4 family AAA+-type ATPase
LTRADLLYEIIKFGLNGDRINFRRVVDAICAEERVKQHDTLAKKIEDLLKNSDQNIKFNNSLSLLRNGNVEQSFFLEAIPQKKLDQLILPDVVLLACRQLIEEQSRAELLRSYGLEPRNKILLIGPPGNGKSSLAEAMAEALMLPLLTVRYESIVGAYLGETTSRLSKLIEYARTRQCVLFFDEFETLGKERGDVHETGEIKRVVSSLLLFIDSLPSYVIVIGATNHETLLDIAAWRRFQLRLGLPKPNKKNRESFFKQFEKKMNFKFELELNTLVEQTKGFSFAEIEELALAIFRRYILNLPDNNIKNIIVKILEFWNKQKNQTTN